MCERVVFSACNSAQHATEFGATRMRLLSLAGGAMRVNAFRSTCVLFVPISLAIIFRQPSLVDCHPCFPGTNWGLLIYTHIDIYASV